MAPAHSSSNLNDIKLEDIGFEEVKDCTDKEVVKRYLKLLEDDGSYFHDLIRVCKDKLLELCPKDYYLLYPRVATDKEVSEITKDLLDWQASVKETDTCLRESRKQKIWSDVPGENVKLPIRGQEANVVSRPNTHRKEEIKDQANKQTSERDEYARDKTKMKDYYRSWEQIDVDAMEEEMDEEERQAEEARRKHFDDMRDEQKEAHKTSSVNVGNLPDGVPEAHRRHMAESEKEKGNEAFYAKDFEEAEAYYTRSLHFRADDTSCWANRALSRLKLGNAAGALQDCDHALAINDRYMKALHRKGKALYELARYEEAVESFQLALKESPGNTQINGDLMIARRKLRSDGPAPAQPKSFAPPPRDPRDQSSCVIEEIFDEDEAPPPASDGKPAPGYTRVAIEEDSSSEEEVEVNKAGFHKVQIQEDSDSEEEEPEKGPAVVSGTTSAATSSSTEFKKIQIVSEDSDSEPEQAPATQSKAPAAGFHKVQVVEESESEDEATAPALAQNNAAAAEVCGGDEETTFDEMD